MNLVKAIRASALLFGMHPVAAYTIVGLGAAAYAPAKYGLITESAPAPRLVAADGWLEVTVVCAALFGTVIGGALVGEAWLRGEVARATRAALALSQTPASSVVTVDAHPELTGRPPRSDPQSLDTFGAMRRRASTGGRAADFQDLSARNSGRFFA